MGTITRWFYGGKDKAFFDRHSDEIRLTNTRTAGTFSMVICGIVVLYTILACVTHIETDLAHLFVTCGILIVLNAYYWLLGRNYPQMTVYFLQILMLCLVAFLLFRDSIDATEYAVFIPLLLVVMPLLFINPMHHTLVSSAVVLVVFIVLSFVVKGVTGYAVYDVIDACIAATFGFFMGQNILRLRLSTIEAYERLKKSTDSELSHAINLANTDPLTGVRSRSAYENLCHKIDMEIRDKTNADFALVVCDINGLKVTNDTLGHEEGDRLIKACCHEICVVYDHSPVFRIGGDEFVTVLKDADYMDRVRLLDLLKEANKKPGVSFAYGMAEFDAASDFESHDVFVKADAEMYQRKKEMKACR